MTQRLVSGDGRSAPAKGRLPSPITCFLGIIDPPESMQLGATVTGSINLKAPPGVELPASALTEADGHPAVWVVDRRRQRVFLRSVDLVRHDPATVAIAHGLEKGDVVVTAGVQTLHPGQKVRLLGAD